MKQRAVVNTRPIEYADSMVGSLAAASAKDWARLVDETRMMTDQRRRLRLRIVVAIAYFAVFASRTVLGQQRPDPELSSPRDSTGPSTLVIPAGPRSLRSLGR